MISWNFSHSVIHACGNGKNIVTIYLLGRDYTEPVCIEGTNTVMLYYIVSIQMFSKHVFDMQLYSILSVEYHRKFVVSKGSFSLVVRPLAPPPPT